MKQLEAHSVDIRDKTFYIRPLPAFRAANLTGELSALLIPLLSGLLPFLGDKDGDKSTSLFDVDLGEAAPAIAGAFSSLSGDRLEEILKHLLITGRNVSVEIDGEKPQMLTEDLANEIFCANVDEMFVLAFEVIRTNYDGFFKKLGVRFGLQEK